MEAKLQRNGLADLVHVDSAGAVASQPGHRPDGRALRVAERYGANIKRNRARRIKDTDFEHFDLILAMDNGNIDDLKQACPAQFSDKIRLVLEFSPHDNGLEVPDPYYGNMAGFDHVGELLDDALEGVIDWLIQARAQG